MNENNETRKDNRRIDNQNCDCEGNCCTPKKNTFNRIIFIVILVAAIGVIGFKITNRPALSVEKESCCPARVSTGNDTTNDSTCDTTNGSSCCPK